MSEPSKAASTGRARSLEAVAVVVIFCQLFCFVALNLTVDSTSYFPLLMLVLAIILFAWSLLQVGLVVVLRGRRRWIIVGLFSAIALGEFVVLLFQYLMTH
jgi:cytochrome c oxidase subunit IV